MHAWCMDVLPIYFPCIACEPPDGYFQVTFLEMTLSRFSSNAVLRCGMSQAAVLSSQDSDADEEDQAGNQQYRLFADNPLKMGFYLDSIGNGDAVHV